MNVRGPGGHIAAHGGGPRMDGRVAAGIVNGRWNVQYMSLIVALNDIGPGDGATCFIPASHKSELTHPAHVAAGGTSSQAGVPTAELAEMPEGHNGLVEMALAAGSAVMFNDNLLHGSMARTNLGERRTLVFRYLPSSYSYRWDYEPSAELLDQLTPRQRLTLTANRGVRTNSKSGNSHAQIGLAANGKDPKAAGAPESRRQGPRL